MVHLSKIWYVWCNFESFFDIFLEKIEILTSKVKLFTFFYLIGPKSDMGRPPWEPLILNLVRFAIFWSHIEGGLWGVTVYKYGFQDIFCIDFWRTKKKDIEIALESPWDHDKHEITSLMMRSMMMMIVRLMMTMIIMRWMMMKM